MRKDIKYLVDLYFSEVMEEDELKAGITEESLKSMFLERKAIINNTRFNGDYKRRLENLGIAYAYVLNLIKNPKSNVDKMFIAYDRLVRVISEYGFMERESLTNGQNQNNAQREIIGLLENFDELVKRFREILNENEAYVQEHEEEVAYLTNVLKLKTKDIRESAVVYHNNVSSYRAGATPAKDVGKARNNWRKERNDGLQIALDFIRDARGLVEGSIRQENKEQGIRIRDYSQIPTNVVFIENLKKIRKSRVYYSFLSESEKKDLERGKTL